MNNSRNFATLALSHSCTTMTTHFAQINSNGGYIGRLSWWNTMDTQAINPHCPVNIRLWGKGPFLLRGWGSAK